MMNEYTAQRICENAAIHRAIARREANPELYAAHTPMPRVTVTGESINTRAEVEGSDAIDNRPPPNGMSLYWRMDSAIHYGWWKEYKQTDHIHLRPVEVAQ